MEVLTEDNSADYYRLNYDNLQNITEEEYQEDLKRFNILRKLINKYKNKNDLRERLIVNNLIILNNVFGPSHLIRILFLKFEDVFSVILPFLYFLNIAPKYVMNVKRERVVDLELIQMDPIIIKKLRDLNAQ